MHRHPPEHILNDLQHFLQPGAIKSCRAAVSKMKKKRDAKLGTIAKLKMDIKELRDEERDAKPRTKKKGSNSKASKSVQSEASAARQKKISDMDKKVKQIQNELKEMGIGLITTLVGLMTKPGAFKSSIVCVNGNEVGQLQTSNST